jgi:FkbM family methyltransferase
MTEQLGQGGAVTGERIIFDFGANNGDDIPYYLLKAERVVAVEANPVLADQIRVRFAEAIASGRLAVESCALTVEATAPAVAFYVHRTNHVLSQFPEPAAAIREQFERITVPAVNVVELIRRYGAPYYVKIDIEHYDQAILRSLFVNKIFPPYISAESHSIDVFALLVGLGDYQAFKLVDGRSVPKRYRNAAIQTLAGEARYDFPEHAAGPFGGDIAGPWMTRNNFFRVLAFAGLGWKDVHASRVDAPDPRHAPQPVVNLQINY